MQWNRTILNPIELGKYAEAVFSKGAPLSNCFGFVDGTMRPITRPGGKPTTAIQRAKARAWVEISVRGPTKWVACTLVWASR